MFAFINSKYKTSPTIIGAGCKFNGEINTGHIVQVHGQVIGNIFADIVIIGRGGEVYGKVHANQFFLHGEMHGPALVDEANIFADAAMTGQLSYNKLNISGNESLKCKLVSRRGKNEQDNI